MRASPPRAFTLIELMVVIAIVGVLVSILFAWSGQPWGANPKTMADELSATLNQCKMRAVSTRHWHRCVLTPQALTMYEWSATGMTAPTGTLCTSGQPPPACFQYVQNFPIPVPVTAWSATTTVCTASPCTGAPTAQTTSLSFNFDFRPDGSSTGGTAFVSDQTGTTKSNIVVYRTTGASYAQTGW
jgi:prepilin-type N-terminal cleavage/methylation domain-containing protein